MVMLTTKKRQQKQQQQQDNQDTDESKHTEKFSAKIHAKLANIIDSLHRGKRFHFVCTQESSI